MKKLMLLAFIFTGVTMTAQNAEFGIKGGLNYGAAGDLSVLESAENLESSVEADNKTGYHIGFYGKMEMLGFFLQPELYYTRFNTEYATFNYKIDKVDLPVLVGVNVFGPLDIKAGPSFQYIFNNELEDTNISIGDVESSITAGYQVGVGLNLGRLGFDVRYEGAFGENTAFSDSAEENFTIDSRPSQWLLSASYRF